MILNVAGCEVLVPFMTSEWVRYQMHLFSIYKNERKYVSILQFVFSSFSVTVIGHEKEIFLYRRQISPNLQLDKINASKRFSLFLLNFEVILKKNVFINVTFSFLKRPVRLISILTKKNNNQKLKHEQVCIFYLFSFCCR